MLILNILLLERIWVFNHAFDFKIVHGLLMLSWSNIVKSYSGKAKSFTVVLYGNNNNTF